jgi:hypothetical protein
MRERTFVDENMLGEVGDEHRNHDKNPEMRKDDCYQTAFKCNWQQNSVVNR